MIRGTGRGQLVRHLDEHWRVTCLEYPFGTVELSPTGVATSVMVADRSHAAIQPPRDSWVAAACTPEGELALVVRNGPPAIVVGTQGHRIAPAGRLDRACWEAAPGERLLLLSSIAFEAAPHTLPGTMGTNAGSVLEQPPEELLRSILSETARGAGAVIDRMGRAGGAA